MGLDVVLLTALISGAMAGVLTPWLRKLANSDSAWFGSRTHVLLGAFLGWAGWPNVFVGTLAAFTLNGIVAVVLPLSGRATRKSATAFGPWMVAGATIGALWAPNALSL